MMSPKPKPGEAVKLLQTVLGAVIIEIRERYTDRVIWSRPKGSGCESEYGSVES